MLVISKKRERLCNVIIFANGNVAAFNQDDKPIPDIQRNIGQILMDYAEMNGFGSDEVGVLFHPNKTPIQFTKRSK